MKNKTDAAIDIFNEMRIDMQESVHGYYSGEDDPYFCVYRVQGDIYYSPDDEELAGKCEIIYVDLGRARNYHIPAIDVFDESAKLLEYYSALFNPRTNWFKDDLIIDKLPIAGNVLILDILTLLPQYRGFGVGRLILRRLIQRYSTGVGVVAVKPFPLQYDKSFQAIYPDWTRSLAFEKLSGTFEEAQAKRQSSNAALGFRPVSDSHPYMFLLPEFQLPNMQQVLER